MATLQNAGTQNVPAVRGAIGTPTGKRMFSAYRYLAGKALSIPATIFIGVFVMIPISLYVARHDGSWLDRLLSLLSPISSVPSWVFAMLLVTIFAA